MALKKSEQRLLIILGAVLVVFLINQFVLSGGDDKKGATPKTTAAQNIKNTMAKTLGDTEEEKEVIQAKVLYDTWGRNPFRNQKLAARSVDDIPGGLVLKGIIRKGSRVYALINNSILTVGQEEEGIRVVSIEGKEVVCQANGKRITLQWKG